MIREFRHAAAPLNAGDRVCWDFRVAFHIGRSAGLVSWAALVVVVAATSTATGVQNAGRLLAASGGT